MDKINTINELYKRLTPVLRMKSNEVNRICKSRGIDSKKRTININRCNRWIIQK